VIEAADLEYWASLGRLGPVAAALAANPDVNLRGNSGYTAMHAAAENGHLEVIRFLASCEAELTPAIVSGETPMDLAELAGQHATVELLRSPGAKHSVSAAVANQSSISA